MWNNVVDVGGEERTFASAGMSFTAYFGFAMLSTKIARVFSSMAAANAAGSMLVTNLTLMPKVGKVTLNWL
jgi:hypothetical protein